MKTERGIWPGVHEVIFSTFFLSFLCLAKRLGGRDQSCKTPRGRGAPNRHSTFSRYHPLKEPSSLGHPFGLTPTMGRQSVTTAPPRCKLDKWCPIHSIWFTRTTTRKGDSNSRPCATTSGGDTKNMHPFCYHLCNSVAYDSTAQQQPSLKTRIPFFSPMRPTNELLLSQFFSSAK